MLSKSQAALNSYILLSEAPVFQSFSLNKRCDNDIILSLYLSPSRKKEIKQKNTLQFINFSKKFKDSLPVTRYRHGPLCGGVCGLCSAGPGPWYTGGQC